jgi:phage gp29-like protein
MASFDNPYGVALLSCCFWAYTFKHNGFRFFVKFCEKYGIPWAIGKYPAGTSVEQQNVLANSLARMVEDAVAAIPDGGEVQLIESGSAGQTLPQERLIDLCNREMSKALTSQTLATEIQGTGSYAASKTHRDREQDVNKSDRQMDMDSMNALLSWVTEINFANAKPPKFEFYSESEARKDWVDVFEGARGYLDIPVSFAYSQLQIPVPVDGEAVLPGAVAKPATTVGQFSRDAINRVSTDNDPSPVTDYTAQLASNAQIHVDKWLAVIKTRADKTEDLHTFQEELLTMYDTLSSEGFTNEMALAFAAAELAGRYDVQQETVD